MAVHSLEAVPAGRPSPQASQTTRLIAPIRGIDARTILARGDPEYCIYCFNLLPSEFGMRVRRGYREWAINIDNGGNLGVGTIIPFEASDNDQANNRLFAVNNEGIWDVTTEEGAPSFVLDFSLAGNGQDTTAEAGYGVFTQYTTDADEQLLFYADSANGLFQYSELTDTWIRAINITGPVIEEVVFVTSHKKRLWFVEGNSNSAWYLPDASIAGTAKQFFFGSKFKHGGNLGGLFTWSIDPGSGLDDLLVAISRSGDILPYQGTDPDSSDNWASAGQWFIGAMPKGNRFASDYAGNLQMLSSYGLITMDELIKGVDGKDINAFTQSQKIAVFVRDQMADLRLDRGWNVKLLPSQGLLMINQPVKASGVFQQFVQNTTTQGWGFWRDLPALYFEEWLGRSYFSTADGRVVVQDVNIDEVLITPDPGSPINGKPIDFSILTSYQSLGMPAVFKRGKYLRADFIARESPTQSSLFRYDYDISEVTNLNTTQLNTVGQWDADLWDQGFWGTNIAEGFEQLQGGWGMGRYVAISMRGNSTTETTLIGWDIVWDAGSPI